MRALLLCGIDAIIQHRRSGVRRCPTTLIDGAPRERQLQALKPHTGHVTQPSAWTSGPPQSGQARERGMTSVRTRILRVMADLL